MRHDGIFAATHPQPHRPLSQAVCTSFFSPVIRASGPPSRSPQGTVPAVRIHIQTNIVRIDPDQSNAAFYPFLSNTCANLPQSVWGLFAFGFRRERSVSPAFFYAGNFHAREERVTGAATNRRTAAPAHASGKGDAPKRPRIEENRRGCGSSGRYRRSAARARRRARGRPPKARGNGCFSGCRPQSGTFACRRPRAPTPGIRRSSFPSA